MSARKNNMRLAIAAMAFMTMAQVPVAWANEDEARSLIKSMSDFMAKQKTISFDFDSSLEVITSDKQKLAIANSGSVTMTRPDKLHVIRRGGFSDAELFFNGKTVSLLRKDKNVVAQAEISGSIDHLVDELRTKYQRSLPAADLLSDNIYEALMPQVNNVKDLGSGFVRGVECDHLALRTSNDVDWQIWIAQGDRPFPMRFIVTTTNLPGSPEYQVDLMNVKTGNDVAATDFHLTRPANAKTSQISDVMNFDELPDVFRPQQ